MVVIIRPLDSPTSAPGTATPLLRILGTLAAVLQPEHHANVEGLSTGASPPPGGALSAVGVPKRPLECTSRVLRHPTVTTACVANGGWHYVMECGYLLDDTTTDVSDAHFECADYGRGGRRPGDATAKLLTPVSFAAVGETAAGGGTHAADGLITGLVRQMTCDHGTSVLFSMFAFSSISRPIVDLVSPFVSVAVQNEPELGLQPSGGGGGGPTSIEVSSKESRLVALRIDSVQALLEVRERIRSSTAYSRAKAALSFGVIIQPFTYDATCHSFQPTPGRPPANASAGVPGGHVILMSHPRHHAAMTALLMEDSLPKVHQDLREELRDSRSVSSYAHNADGSSPGSPGRRLATMSGLGRAESLLPAKTYVKLLRVTFGHRRLVTVVRVPAAMLDDALNVRALSSTAAAADAELRNPTAGNALEASQLRQSPSTSVSALSLPGHAAHAPTSRMVATPREATSLRDAVSVAQRDVSLLTRDVDTAMSARAAWTGPAGADDPATANSRSAAMYGRSPDAHAAVAAALREEVADVLHDCHRMAGALSDASKQSMEVRERLLLSDVELETQVQLLSAAADELLHARRGKATLEEECRSLEHRISHSAAAASVCDTRADKASDVIDATRREHALEMAAFHTETSALLIASNERLETQRANNKRELASAKEHHQRVLDGMNQSKDGHVLARHDHAIKATETSVLLQASRETVAALRRGIDDALRQQQTFQRALTQSTERSQKLAELSLRYDSLKRENVSLEAQVFRENQASTTAQTVASAMRMQTSRVAEAVHVIRAAALQHSLRDVDVSADIHRREIQRDEMRERAALLGLLLKNHQTVFSAARLNTLKPDFAAILSEMEEVKAMLKAASQSEARSIVAAETAQQELDAAVARHHNEMAHVTGLLQQSIQRVHQSHATQRAQLNELKERLRAEESLHQSLFSECLCHIHAETVGAMRRLDASEGVERSTPSHAAPPVKQPPPAPYNSDPRVASSQVSEAYLQWTDAVHELREAEERAAATRQAALSIERALRQRGEELAKERALSSQLEQALRAAEKRLEEIEQSVAVRQRRHENAIDLLRRDIASSHDAGAVHCKQLGDQLAVTSASASAVAKRIKALRLDANTLAEDLEGAGHPVVDLEEELERLRRANDLLAQQLHGMGRAKLLQTAAQTTATIQQQLSPWGDTSSRPGDVSPPPASFATVPTPRRHATPRSPVPSVAAEFRSDLSQHFRLHDPQLPIPSPDQLATATATARQILQGKRLQPQ